VRRITRWVAVRDGSGGAEEPGKAGVAPTARRWGGRSVGVLRAWGCHLHAGFQQMVMMPFICSFRNKKEPTAIYPPSGCRSFVEMDTVRCDPLCHGEHCPTGTVPWVLVRRITSPAHAGFGGLSSGSALVIVRLDVVPLPPHSSAPTVAGCRLG
jgi:hypothetical protein